MKISRRDVIADAIGGTSGMTAVTLAALALKLNSESDLTPRASFPVEDSFRFVEAKGLPGHEIEGFPNQHDQIAVKSQEHRLRVPARPVHSNDPIAIDMWWFGVAVNGIPFDLSGPFSNGDVFSDWQFEVRHPTNAIFRDNLPGT